MGVVEVVPVVLAVTGMVVFAAAVSAVELVELVAFTAGVLSAVMLAEEEGAVVEALAEAGSAPAPARWPIPQGI